MSFYKHTKKSDSTKHNKWLEERVEFSQSTATRFMNVANEFGNSSTLKNLNQSKLFALLEVPKEERQDFIIKGENLNSF